MTRYEILLPLRYNDGSEVGQALFDLTRDELIARFHAVTVEPEPIRGFWVFEGQRYDDHLMRMFVVVIQSKENKEFFREFKERLKERLQQKDIWITAHTVQVV